MVDITAQENAFESSICEDLGEHGWLYNDLRPFNDRYDRKLALYAPDVFAWLEETQPEQFAKVVKVGTASEAKQRQQLLGELVKRLNTPGGQDGG
jgi:type I restriction enzyme R subunit